MLGVWFEQREITYSDGEAVDDSVGQVQKSQVHVVDKIREVGVIVHDRDGGEGLVQSGREGQSEGLGVEAGVPGQSGGGGGLKAQVLHLVLLGHDQVVAHGQHVVAIGAHALGAVDVAVGGVANAAAGLAGVPVVIVEGQLTALEVREPVLIPSSGEGHILDILACSVATAIVGAGGALARLALITVKASALSGSSVANTSAGTFSILVERTKSIRSINPSKLKGADAVRAVSAVVI